MFSKIFIAIPAMNESEYLPGMFHSLANQTHPPAKVFVCVNQPDAWWNETGDKLAVCHDNGKTLDWLLNFKDLDVEVIDRSSPGKGWQGNQSGAGWARRVATGAANLAAGGNDLIGCMDADTDYPPDYLQNVCRAFSAHPAALALAAPFYHRLGPSEDENRALLRYELYMRQYFLNLIRINSPYAFIALGSAITVPAHAYRKVRGITPFKAGEDFYFLQKLRKAGMVLNHCDSVVYPSCRVSSRAGFGTGPAIGKGLAGDWRSYPFFPKAYFDRIRETYQLFPNLYDQNMPTPMDDYLEKQFGTACIWEPLRRNFKTCAHFVRACHEKIDGLRLFQYLRYCRKNDAVAFSDEDVLSEFMKNSMPDSLDKPRSPEISLEYSSIAELDRLRNMIFKYELEVRKRLS